MKKMSEWCEQHKLFGVLSAIVVVVIWLGISSVGGPTFGKISDVSTNDQASFLPSSAESTKVATVQKKFQNSDTLPAIIAITSEQTLSAKDLQSIAAATEKLKTIDGVASSPQIAGPIPSQDKKAVELIVPVESSSKIKDVVKNIRHELSSKLDDSLQSYVTGPAGLSADLVAAFGGIDGLLLLVALGAVFVILLIVYRSILLPIIVLLLDVIALSGSILVVYSLAKSGAIALNGQSQGILSILVIGASTDYSLLLVSRYRENLHKYKDKWPALFSAIKGSIEPIAASAATVIIALLCLLFSDLRSNQGLGPVAAVGIATSFIASMTFLPALLALFGRAAFWPNRPVYDKKALTSKAASKGLWSAVARFVGKKPRLIWITSSLVLVVCALGLTQLQASGTSTADTIRTESNAVDGQQALAEHFPAGSGDPVVIVTTQSQANDVLSTVKSKSGVEMASLYTGGSPFGGNPPVVKDGQVLLNVTLTDSPGSSAAEKTITSLRNNLHSDYPGTLVGGQTATLLDTTTTAKDDIYKIIPIVLVVVFIILALLLRALVAPILLVLSVMLSFAATLGISALIFNHVFHFPGADPAVPLFGFVFLVALGIDYNIFLMSRVREEAKKMATRPAILQGLLVTGGVITSAGIVLAATFAALGVIPILFLVQIAFIVAFGVLLDTLIVRSLIIPALSYDIGSNIWWPSKLAKKSK